MLSMGQVARNTVHVLGFSETGHGAVGFFAVETCVVWEMGLVVVVSRRLGMCGVTMLDTA